MKTTPLSVSLSLCFYLSLCVSIYLSLPLFCWVFDAFYILDASVAFLLHSVSSFVTRGCFLSLVSFSSLLLPPLLLSFSLGSMARCSRRNSGRRLHYESTRSLRVTNTNQAEKEEEEKKERTTEP